MTLVTLDAPPAPRCRAGAVSRWGCLRTALLAYALTSTAVLLGVMLARDYVKTSPHMKHRPVDQDPLLRGFVRWDGYFYREIVTAGYSYQPGRASSVAFFPLYPLLARAVVRLTGAPAEVALLVVSHACLVGAFVVLAAYVRRRWPDGPPELGPAVLLAFGLWPWGYFFRMGYSESLFALLCLVALYGIQRRWGLLPLGFVVGLATAARPVGVGLLLPLAVHLWHHSATARGFVGRLAVAALLGCWGLAAYMLYLYLQFGDPLAFAQTQTHWRLRPPAPLPVKALDLINLEPIWGIFDPGSGCYGKGGDITGGLSVYSPAVVNRAVFLVAVVLTVLGAVAGWLSRVEVALAAALLLIPYLTRGHEMCMASMARFSSAAVPIYLVLGQALLRTHPLLRGCLVAVSGFLLGTYAGLFAAWHRLY